MQDLVGKVAVVTGAGSGIGRALATRMAAEEMSVVLGDADADAAAETARLIEESTPGAPTRVVAVDVRDFDAVTAFADEAFDAWGQVDLLCNNAGVFVGGYLWSQSLDELRFVLDVNLWGILHGIRAFVPRMIAQDTEGHIVNTASVSGLFGSAYSGPYSTSKFAAFAATESLAGDLLVSGSKLRASVLCPGVIRTGIAVTAQRRPDLEGRAVGEDEKFVNDLLTDMVEKGVDPSHVADCVIDAVRTQRFLVLTHEHHGEFLARRAEELVSGRLPSIVDFT